MKNRATITPLETVSFTLSLLLLAGVATAQSNAQGWKVVSCSSEETAKATTPAFQAIDGDPSTLWHTAYRPAAQPPPHEIVIDFGRALELTGFRYLPRQDGGMNGVVQRYEVAVSNDGVTWGEPAARGEFAGIVNEAIEQRIAFAVAAPGRFLRFRSLAVVNDQPFTSVAELGIYTGPIPAMEPKPVICFALYTVQDRILKLTAQLYPDRCDPASEVVLEVERDGAWVAADRARPPILPGWTVPFRVERWDATRDVRYRVRLGEESYGGLVRRDPIDKSVIVAAAFTGNSPGPGGGQISKADVAENVAKLDPDVLLFTGDQVYDHNRHTEHWLRFGEDFGDIIRDRPTVTIPDDHDVGHPNLWGANGRACKRDFEGGYMKSPEYVMMVERAQTSHLPDPFDPTPVEQGIGVYYTRLVVGGIDFAIIEDRKFKSGCLELGIEEKELGPRPDHIAQPEYDPEEFDLPGLELLGERQMRFLESWSMDWEGVAMKSVVSQTLFAMASNYHSGNKTFYHADFDANGWPQTARDEAVDVLRRCFAFHICGDQHLSTIVQYGIDDFRDSGFGFCVPSIANLWPRWWAPKTPALGPVPGGMEHTGDYHDGFGNKLTVYTHTNPRETGREPAALHDRMPGFGVVRFDRAARTITMECWPRMVDPTDPMSEQYEGWPKTIDQTDNYGRVPVAWLPEVSVEAPFDPVFWVCDADGKTVYSLCPGGKTFQPWVFAEGEYTLRIGEPSFYGFKRLTVQAARDPSAAGTLKVEF